jgi:hypothetical protein
MQTPQQTPEGHEFLILCSALESAASFEPEVQNVVNALKHSLEQAGSNPFCEDAGSLAVLRMVNAKACKELARVAPERCPITAELLKEENPLHAEQLRQVAVPYERRLLRFRPAFAYPPILLEYLTLEEVVLSQWRKGGVRKKEAAALLEEFFPIDETRTCPTQLCLKKYGGLLTIDPKSHLGRVAIERLIQEADGALSQRFPDLLEGPGGRPYVEPDR